MRRNHLVPAVAAMATLLALAAGASAQVTFTAMGDLPGGIVRSRGRAVSGDGTVVVGMSTSTSGDEAARWTGGTLLGLGDLPGGAYSSDAFACSADGSVVFGAATNSAGNREAFRWVGPNNLAPLGFIPAGGYSTTIYACSADGTIACGDNLYQPPPNPVPPLPVTQAFRWTQAGIEALGFLPGTGFLSTLRGMSADGSIMVGWAMDSSSTYRPITWTRAAGIVDFSGGTRTAQARACSADGLLIVGTQLAPTAEGFRWTQGGGFELIGFSAGFTSSSIADCSADGKRLVGVNSFPGGTHAFMWDEGLGWRAILNVLNDAGLDMSGWSLLNCLSLSDDGTVLTGSGSDASGATMGWIATIPRPPTCGSADFNGDGDTGTDSDIEAFFACLGGNCCGPCGTADFNADGDTGTDADIEAFFRVLGGGTC